MRPINGWREARAAGSGRQLPADGYPLKIKQAKVETNSKGRDMLVVAFDISGGEYAGFFDEQFKRNDRPNKKWQGVYRINLPMEETDDEKVYDSYRSRMKGFVNAVEESNPGYNFEGSRFDERTLAGKAVAGVFRREQFKGSDGKLYFSTKMNFAISMESLQTGNFTVPKDRLLDDSDVEPDLSDFVPTDADEGLPF